MFADHVALVIALVLDSCALSLQDLDLWLLQDTAIFMRDLREFSSVSCGSSF